jgi:hypothetical protein
MRFTVTLAVLLLNLLTLNALAKSSCACYPVPESKSYQGPARKKHWIGYSIDWSCQYRCTTNFENDETPIESVTGFYHEFYIRTEMGTEGICEGMTYEPKFNALFNRDVYFFNGNTFGLSPEKSKSAQLREWAQKNSCEQRTPQ